MNDKKMISIEQFNADERLAVEQTYKGLARSTVNEPVKSLIAKKRKNSIVKLVKSS